MLDLVQKNTRKQGDVGLGISIGWFCSNGYTVNIPLTDNQKYDLIVEKDDELFKVQVKTTRHKTKFGVYRAFLKTNGGNMTGSGKTILFESSSVDFLFVLCEDNSKYLIPSENVESKHCLNLGSKMKQFLVE